MLTRLAQSSTLVCYCARLGPSSLSLFVEICYSFSKKNSMGLTDSGSKIFFQSIRFDRLRVYIAESWRPVSREDIIIESYIDESIRQWHTMISEATLIS